MICKDIKPWIQVYSLFALSLFTRTVQAYIYVVEEEIPNYSIFIW